MKVLNLPRGEGRTKKAIREAAATDAYLLVLNRTRAYSASQLAISMGLDIRFPITFEEYMDTKLQGSWIKNIVIDDAHEMFLSLFKQVKIDMVTLSIEGDLK